MKEQSICKRLTYPFLFAIQMFGSEFLVWKGLPAFRELVLASGAQLVNTPYDSSTVIAALAAGGESPQNRCTAGARERSVDDGGSS